MQKHKKDKIRFEMLAFRDSILLPEVREKSSSICQKLTSIPEIQSSKNIAVYHSIRNEVDLSVFNLWCLKTGKTLICPVTTPRDRKSVV